tara:strand:- start:2441 stop:3058 length:618 start_codon:yes stop_codon:yes gene_type:complete
LNTQNKKFVYLISPNTYPDKSFYKNLNLVLKTNIVSFFQLRLKSRNKNKIISIAKKIHKICKKNKVKFILNDDPHLAKIVKADGCHLGQKDMNIVTAKKILKNKIIGITCHNSIRLAKKASLNDANYIAIGAFYKTKTKKVSYKVTTKTLKKIKKIVKKPIVAIGGINEKNYKNLLLNKADFLAISSYVWKNKKYKPLEAIKKLK